MKDYLRIGRNIGAVIGTIAFLAVGLVPAFHFGSYGTIILLSHLTGGPLEGSLLVRAAVVVGTVMGMFCMASVSIVVGSVLGTAVGWLTQLVAAPAAEMKESEARSKQ
jgi:hypothetical protein